TVRAYHGHLQLLGHRHHLSIPGHLSISPIPPSELARDLEKSPIYAHIRIRSFVLVFRNHYHIERSSSSRLIIHINCIVRCSFIAEISSTTISSSDNSDFK